MVNTEIYNKLLKKEGLIDIDAFRGTRELQIMNFEMMMFQNFMNIRKFIRSGMIHELHLTIKTVELTVFNYLSEEDKQILNTIDSQTANRLRNLGSIENYYLRKKIEEIIVTKNVFAKLERLNNALYRNFIFYNTEMFLIILTHHYSSLSGTVMNPLTFFYDLLFLKALCFPYASPDKLEELANDLERTTNNYRYLTSHNNFKLANKFLLDGCFRMMYTLTKILDNRGILFEKRSQIDLSLASFEKTPVSQNEKFATLFLKEIYDRTHKDNRNWLAVIVGKTGSGKSYSALSLAKMLDPTFNSARVVFSFEEFMRIIDSLKDKKEQGEAIIWDETGVDLDSRRFFETVNILANKILQTFRSDCFNVIFTVPDASFIDSRTRKLFHHIIETKTILRSSEKCVTSWYETHRAVANDKDLVYQPRMMFEGKRFVVKDVLIPKPDDTLIKEYEEMKSKFNSQLKDFVKGQMDEQGRKPVKKTDDELRELASKTIKEELSAFSVVRNGKHILNSEHLSLRFDLTNKDSRKLKTIIESMLN